MASYRYSDRYQYETSPRKLQPEYEEPEKQKSKKKKKVTLKENKSEPKKQKHVKTHIKAVVYVLLVFVALFVISYRNSLINESFNENEELKTELADLEKQNEQLKVNLENNLNLSTIEESAEKLGMQKLDSSQKVYVSLDKEDYVEPASEKVVMDDDETWITKLLNTLLGK